VNDVANDVGVAFATTSYPTNGLAVLPAVDDMVNLVRVFSDTYGSPETVLIAGVSEGGLVTTLAVERLPHVFDGGLAACGPIGSWTKGINNLGDFRVLFDYFFPDLLPSDVVTIPNWLIDQWSNNDYFAGVVEPVVFDPASAVSLTQLLATSGLPYVPSVTDTIRTAVHDALAYNVLATNDAMEKLGGNPFDNIGRVYSGSADDAALNANVRRFSADQAALAENRKYETSGRLTRPLVTLHTSRDQQVPQWQESLYRQKVLARHTWMWHIDQPVPVDAYGHCNFDVAEEVMPAFFALLGMVADPPQPSIQYLPAAFR
jgi:pimeloyl-ACP methyl ester carboxylesterase